jgi:ribonucleoside-diphosphate reductase alpha chain
MTESAKILSDITVYAKYAKFLADKNRRETWDETIDRYLYMMLDKYCPANDRLVFDHVRDHHQTPQEFRACLNAMTEIGRGILLNSFMLFEKMVLPSMRGLQFAGEAIKRHHNRLYNCAFLPLDSIESFAETMFLLLGGSGVGYSVQKFNIEQLPAIKRPLFEAEYLIADTIEGWADAVKVLLEAHMGKRVTMPVFNYSLIRPKGSVLKTAGGKAPGPDKLRETLEKIAEILNKKKDGEQLTSLECHDIQCHIANAVVAGGIRRSAMICLFDFDDTAMRRCKTGAWWEQNSQRGRSNNSAVIVRGQISFAKFWEIWTDIRLSGSGEPGLYFTNNPRLGTNPCCEISLLMYQFCNLVEVNVSDVADQADLNARSVAAAFFATLQAGFTDFTYLRPVWKETTEREALIGVGQTGIASGAVLNLCLPWAAELVKEENRRVAALIGINPAARTTTVKPSGTSSLVLGTSSGIHAWHSLFYFRRLRLGKEEALYKYLVQTLPELIEDDKFDAANTAVLTVPQKAPHGAIVRTESMENLLERIKRWNVEWVRSGHVSGDNTNNVSATVSVEGRKVDAYLDKLRKWTGRKLIVPELSRWDKAGTWIWENQNSFNGMSVLPYDGGTYVQAPFEDCTEEQYNDLLPYLKGIDLTKVVEDADYTSFTQELACAGGACEVN